MDITENRLAGPSAYWLLLPWTTSHPARVLTDFPSTGPLDLALSCFGAQAGINMAVSSTLTEGKYSKGLQGNFSTIAGLERLLESTGLSFQLNADDGYKLHPTTVL